MGNVLFFCQIFSIIYKDQTGEFCISILGAKVLTISSIVNAFAHVYQESLTVCKKLMTEKHQLNNWQNNLFCA